MILSNAHSSHFDLSFSAVGLFNLSRSPNRYENSQSDPTPQGPFWQMANALHNLHHAIPAAGLWEENPTI